jgi:signal transduction histidine kinase
MNDNPASTLSALKDKIISQWQFRARASIADASTLAEPILVDTLPIYLDKLIDAVEGSKPFATVDTTQSLAHGRERALMTDFSCAQVIHEFQLLRKVILDLVRREQFGLSPHQVEILDASIEVSIRESAYAFSESRRHQTIDFISSFMHDLRNPLHVASVTAQLLASKDLPADVRVSVARIDSKLRTAGELIDSLLDTTTSGRAGRMRLEIGPVDMTELAREVADATALPDQPVTVTGELVEGYWCRVSLRRALENLVTNAQKYGSRTAPIVIRVERIDARALVSVHNDGEPIDKADMNKLFSGYRHLTTTPVRGWGLGLPFVQQVAEAHGGSIIVESNAGSGTTFRISIPLDGRQFHTGSTDQAAM